MKFQKKDINDFELSKDLLIIKSIANDISNEELATKCDLPLETIDDFYCGSRTEATKDELEKIYNFAFNNKIYLSDIKWQMYNDELANNNHFVLCHGSRDKIIGDIRLDASGDSNDFSNGFYCGETVKQAGMFVSAEPDSSLYLVEADLSQMSALRFTVNRDWMFAVAYYRDTLGDFANNSQITKIINECENADVIIAPIADNRMFELIDAFIAGELTDKQCIYAMSATQLGMQYVFKTQHALDNIHLLERCYLCASEKGYYNRSNERESYTGINKALLAKKFYSNEGKYIEEILQ